MDKAVACSLIAAALDDDWVLGCVGVSSVAFGLLEGFVWVEALGSFRLDKKARRAEDVAPAWEADKAAA